MSDITERLRARRVTRWVHATGQAPQASGYSVDAECQEAADAIESRDATIAELRSAFETATRQLGEWAEAMRKTVDERDKLRAQVEALQQKAKRCGGENCMGHRVDGVANWVREERLIECQKQVEALRDQRPLSKSTRLDALRFRTLIETSPGCLCFMGQDYRTADAFRAAIDAARSQEDKG